MEQSFSLLDFLRIDLVLSPEFIAWFAISLPISLRWIGVILGIIAIPLLLWIHQTIGKYWVGYLDLNEHHHLVRDGPYHWVRHPMYSQSILFLIALSLVSSNLLMVSACIIVVILIINRIPREERMMIERFGNDYHDYMKRTRRLLPPLIYEAD